MFVVVFFFELRLPKVILLAIKRIYGVDSSYFSMFAFASMVNISSEQKNRLHKHEKTRQQHMNNGSAFSLSR